MDVASLISQGSPPLPCTLRESHNDKSDFTHVVVGINYGEEACCVLSLRT